MSAHPLLRWQIQFGPALRPIVTRHVLGEDNCSHEHDFMELVVVLGGRGRHKSAAGATALDKGTALLLRPGIWHCYSECERLELVNVCFPVDVVRSEWRALLSERIRGLLRLGEGLKAVRLPLEVAETFDRLETISRTDAGAAGLMIWILDQFANAYPDQWAPMHPAVEMAVCALEDDPGRDWTVAELASYVGLERAYLSRLFAQHVESGPMAYLAMLRAERAAALLRATSLKCGEIALEVGYTDPNLFSRRFRARFGKSPSEYRAALTVDEPREGGSPQNCSSSTYRRPFTVE